MKTWQRQILVGLLLTLVLPLLAGCWSRHEIEDLAIISAIALDAAPGGQVRLSIFVVIPRVAGGGSAAGGGGGGEPRKVGEIISATGSDFSQAARRLEALTPRRLFFAQNRALIIGEELAGRGLHYLDLFSRERQMRLTMPVFITRGEARKVLELPPGIELAPGTILSGILRNKTTFKVELKDLLAMWEAPGDNPVLPEVVLTPTPDQESGETGGGSDQGGKGSGQGGKPEKPPEAVAIKGAGAFRHDRLAGWLDEKETSGFMWLRGEVKEGVVTVPLPSQGQGYGGDSGQGPAGGLASIMFHRISTNTQARVEGQQVVFQVEIRGHGDLMETTVNLNLDDQGQLLAIQQAVNKTVEERTLAVLGKAQKELRSDIFGYGETLHRSNVRYWRQVADRWNEEFTRARVEIKVNISIGRMGMTNRTPGPIGATGGKSATQGTTR